jgi:hypothetical protein
VGRVSGLSATRDRLDELITAAHEHRAWAFAAPP